ncbi:MAG TPA: STAS domain-containing protein [Acidobacteriota bacterium]
MPQSTKSRILDLLEKHQPELLSNWLREQQAFQGQHGSLISDTELRKQSSDFIALLQQALREGNHENLNAPIWKDMKDFLGRLSYSRAEKGFSPSETAIFVFSFKQPLFALLKKELGNDASALANETWTASSLLDQLGLYTTEVYQSSRNTIIARQEREIMELSTPVVQLWPGIVALPLIGTLDSARTQVVMENLLKSLVDTGSSIAIIDITGVPTVDTLVAQHLLKTVSAARLMGAECFVSGIRPQIAQTIVHLGVSLPDVVTKANLADAFALALRRIGMKVIKTEGAAN